MYKVPPQANISETERKSLKPLPVSMFGNVLISTSAMDMHMHCLSVLCLY